MSLLGSEQQERFEAMQKDVNRSDVQWWFYRSEAPPNSDLDSVLSFLSEDALKIGPLGQYNLTDEGRPKDLFYGIPLRTIWQRAENPHQSYLAFVATNPDAGILMKSVYAYFSQNEMEKQREFRRINFSAVCVQIATTHDGTRVVVAVDAVKNMRCSAFYEHPTNGRLLQAMSGEIVPDQSALVFFGDTQNSVETPLKTNAMLTLAYNEYETGSIEQTDLSLQIFNLFFKENENESGGP